MQPRGSTWPEVVQLDVPRDQTGTGEYMRLLSEARPVACWSGAHRAVSKPTHWELAPSAAGLRVHRIKIRQHYETPAAAKVTATDGLCGGRCPIRHKQEWLVKNLPVRHDGEYNR